MSSLLALIGNGSEQHANRVQAEYEREVASLALATLTLPVRTLDVVHVAPWIFSDVTNSIDDTARIDIAVSALLYRDYLLAFDAPIDGDARVDAVQLLAAGQWHERSLTRLSRVVQSDSTMWNTLARLARRQIAAAVDERALNALARRGESYDFESYATLAAAKSAIFVAIPAACCAAAGRDQLVGQWEAVLDPFSIATQLRDDLTDWRDDWNAGKLTYAHVRALEAGGLLAAFGQGERPSAETVGHLLFHGGVASELLADSLDACDASIEAAQIIGAGQWARFARHVRTLGEQMAVKISERRTKAGNVVAQCTDAHAMREPLSRLVHALTAEHARGYPEASHPMQYISNSWDAFVRPGAQPVNGIHEGAVFHRAIIGWFYARCERAGVSVPAQNIEENLDALADMRVPGETLWSYHPTFAALPPDLDDVAQVLWAFLGSKTARDMNGLFANGVHNVLATQQEDGAIETWIIEPTLTDAWKQRYTKQIEEFWAPGAEPEVVANFAGALLEWKPDVYKGAVVRAADWVARQQADDGSWASTWYVGPYYGTFVAARLLHATVNDVGAAQAAMQRARTFLIDTQRADGGWSVTDRSDSTSTAFALLALSELVEGRDDAIARDAIERGVRWLMLAQRSDGFWLASVDFICYDLHRAAASLGERFRFFRSTTVTSAYAGAALLAAERWLPHD